MLERHDFANPSDLARHLAARVADDLVEGSGRRPLASLAVSGGSTPALFLETLGGMDRPAWPETVVTLVDERWVDNISKRSNAAFVKNHLLRGPARQARFFPLYRKVEKPDANTVARINSEFEEQVPLPFDALVLGMGEDGHTASLFPGADNLPAALAEPGPVLAITAPQTGEQRITLTLPAILNARNIYLHIEGEKKVAALERALAGDDIARMPVRAVLQQSQRPLQVFWSP